MTFQYPFILWGLLSLSIPILIHLFTFRRFKVIEFSTIQFIDELKEDTKRKKRLKHILILISRLLFLFFLVLAFAQPSLIDRSNASVKSSTIIYLDNSMSMSDEIAEGQLALDEGIDYVLKIISEFPLEQRILLLTNDFSKPLNSWSYQSAVTNQLTELDLGPEHRSFGDIIDKVSFLGNNNELYYVSDFQKSTLDNLALADTSLLVHLVPINANDQKNVYVDSIYTDGPTILDRPSKVWVDLRNSGEATSEEFQVKLLNGNKLISTQSISFGISNTNTISFDVDLRNATTNSFRIEIVDYPVVFDNIFYFRISPYTPPVISYVYADEPNYYLERVFANQDYFNFAGFGLNDVNYTRLENSDFIIIEGFETIPEGLHTVKEQNILLIPSINSDKSSYERFVGSSVIEMSDSLMNKLTLSDPNHPFFADIFRSNLDKADFPTARLRYTFRRNSDRLLLTEFGDPYLALTGAGSNIYFLSSPLESTYTNFPTHSLFLPTLYRMAYTGNRSSEPLAFSIDDDVITFDLGDFDRTAQFNIVSPNSDEFIPNFIFQNENIVFQLPPGNLIPGIYHLRTGTDTVKSFALNQSKLESKFEFYSRNELSEFSVSQDNIEILDAMSGDELKMMIAERNSGLRLWKYALILAIIFLLSESLLIRLL